MTYLRRKPQKGAMHPLFFLNDPIDGAFASGYKVHLGLPSVSGGADS